MISTVVNKARDECVCVGVCVTEVVKTVRVEAHACSAICLSSLHVHVA